MDQETNNIEEQVQEQVLQQDLDELRSILTGMDQKELEKIKAWLTDVDAFAEDISVAIPLSIKQLVQKRIVLPETLLPIIEEAIESSVLSNPQKLANALFPIMGPAIRKAVAEDLKKMIDSLNRTLESSFSPKRWGWRLQSVFSGRSYAEIVLSHSLLYRVQQVFLIHKRTGIMLQHVVDDSTTAKDPDLISAMLTAINDFVQDSMGVKKDENVESIQVGGYNVWIEQGPHAILAGIVEGNPPLELRETFKQAIEKIHLDLSRSLVHFDGDVSAFDENKDQLMLCLQKQSRHQKTRKPILAIILIIILLGLAGYWAYGKIESGMRWDSYIGTLEDEPGILVTNTYKKDGKRFVEGMRDPLSKDPSSFLSQFGFVPEQVLSDWGLFYSLNNDFILKRAVKKLEPTDSVLLELNNGLLYLKGTADKQWIEKAKILYPEVLGIDSLNTDSLNAPVAKVKLTSLVQKIDKMVFEFEYGVTTLSAGQYRQIDTMATVISRMISNAEPGLGFEVQVIGYTSNAGNVAGNREYILRRANLITRALYERGIPEQYVTSEIKIFDRNELQGLNPRSVSIDVKLQNENQR